MGPKHHTGTIKAEEEKRRTVFKPILDNPYTKITWPTVEDSETILQLIVELLSPIGTHAEYIKKNVFPLPDSPGISEFVSLGFNPTMELLEGQAQKIFHDGEFDSEDDRLAIVFVCRSDIDSVLMTSHFPISCAAASSPEKSVPPVKLVQLPKGSMVSLSKSTGENNLGIIGLKSEAPGAKKIFELAENIDSVHVPWINDIKVGLKTPVIKNLKTSAPVKVKKQKKKQK